MFADKRSWERVGAALAQDRSLILITGPGHGESGDPDRRYDLLQCTRAAAEVLDALGVAEPVDWVGNAWGGHVGVRFATAYPHRIRSLVTIGTPVQALSTTERVRTRVLLLVHRLLGPARFVVDAVFRRCYLRVGVMAGTPPSPAQPAGEIVAYIVDHRVGIAVGLWLFGLATVPLPWWFGSL